MRWAFPLIVGEAFCVDIVPRCPTFELIFWRGMRPWLVDALIAGAFRAEGISVTSEAVYSILHIYSKSFGPLN